MFLLGMLAGAIAAPIFWIGTAIGALSLYRHISKNRNND
jgi:hypothetical protein